MADLASTPDLRRILQDIDRRLRNLEGAPQLQRASLTGGKITALNADGDRVAEYGELAGGGYGVAVNDADTLNTLLLVNDIDGVHVPVIEHAWQKANDSVAVTSGSFVTAWATLIPVPLARCITATITVVTGAGTTGEVRLTAVGIGSTTAKTCPAGAQTDATFSWDLGTNLGLGVSGVLINVEARRTGGANSVAVFEPLSLRESSAYTAVVGGLVP